MTAEELFTQWGHRAMLTVRDDGSTLGIFAVIAVFDRPGGYLVVRPGYNGDLPAPMPRVHRIEGTTTRAARQTLHTDDGDGREFFLEPVDEDDPAHVHDSIAAWERIIDEQGLTPAQERDALRAELQGAFED